MGATWSPGAAFGRYALPSDDKAGLATSVTVGGGSPSEEDEEYPATNLIAPTNTGHYNLPSRPAKLMSQSGSWTLAFASAIEVVGAALIYHNLDAGLDVTIEGGGGAFSQAIIIPASPWTDGFTISPWVLFDSPQTYDEWELSINAANSLPVQVGRLLLLGAIRDLENDVRWGVVENEDYLDIAQPTELAIEVISELGGPRRSFAGEFALRNDKASEFQTLNRGARGRVLPWLLIPDADINDAWFVRFEEPRWTRTRENIEHNIFPYRVKELSRGLPFP